MIRISFDETHHIKDDKPLYNTRYTKVMSFHENIAPVQLNDVYFFIDTKNRRLFNRTYKKAYGFYEGLSAVSDNRGWFHIDLNGKPIYLQRYAWVGNFQEGISVVRDINNNYFHIDREGFKIYDETYNYCGDFKYGIAVVVNQKGKSTHIDIRGKQIHGKFFDELDVFHKGYAIAKDNNGYFHINKKAQALYNERYKKLEPFYNGVALATDFKNQKIIINEDEIQIRVLTPEQINKNQILDESFGYFKYQILFALLRLDVLKNIDENRGIDLPSVSKKIIFRWLYVENLIDKNHSLTTKGLIVEKELKSIILYWQDLPFKISSQLVDSLKKGDEVFSQFYNRHFFDYLEENKSLQKLTSRVNAYYTTDYQPLLEKLSLSNETVCDIGGGDGILLTKLKQQYNIQTILADKFKSSEYHEFYKINFFEPFFIKADIFILSRVLHDWSDEKAILILQNIAENMTSESILYIFETIVPVTSKVDKGHTLSFHLLSFLGGYERTFDEYEKILHKANLKIVKIYLRENLISILKVQK